VEVGQLPREDPLTPREYAPAYPATPYPAERYPAAPAPYPAPAPAAPAYRDPYDDSAPATGGVYQPPAYPPGAAYPQPTYPIVAPTPRLPPESPPVAPRTPRPAIPEPDDETLALAPPIEADTTPAQPMVTPPPAPAAPRPAVPPPRPADLPPAEITREGNQAVVALLDSADKYVKGGQLDKAGAALERALRIEPRNAGIWHDLAQIRLHQGQYQQAESLASKSNNLASGNRALQSRNWKLISVARKAGGNTAGAEEAEAQASLLSR
jgi:tetratricopeptide (TPR) repeat protein